MFDFAALAQIAQREIMAPTVEATEPVPDDLFMTADELSVRWRIETSSLANLRSKGEGIPFVKLPSGSIRYRLCDVLEAERDGQHGFTWENLRKALATYDGKLSANERERLVTHLKRNMR